MQRTFLDMTKGISRSTNRVVLSPINLTTDSVYFIFGTTEWSVNTVLPEMQINDLTNKFIVTINGKFVPNDSFVVVADSTGVYIKFIQSQLSYPLDSDDTVILKGDLTRHA
jgi:hypothetical protein